MFFHRFKKPLFFTLIPLIPILTYILSQKLWRPPFKTPRPLTYYKTSLDVELVLSESCKRLLTIINPPIPALLIDSDILMQIANGNCEKAEKSVKIGVDEKLKTRGFGVDGQFDSVFFRNSSDKDYLEFRTYPKTIIPKNFPYKIIGNWKIPTKIMQFLEFQKRSKFVGCKNITVTRDPPKYSFLSSKFFKNSELPAKESIENLAKLRDELLIFGMVPFLNGGTLLGWYRECSVIPHTKDMDIGVFGETWNSEFMQFLWSFNSSFTLIRQLGLVDDSYELTVIPKSGLGRPIDLFLMYQDYKNGKEYRWVGGLTTSGDKIKYIYPDFDPFCAADLMGHIFWVTCTPEKKITEEYGPTWYLDQNTSKYVWYGAKNAEENGKFTKRQMMTETYNEYKSNL